MKKLLVGFRHLKPVIADKQAREEEKKKKKQDTITLGKMTLKQITLEEFNILNKSGKIKQVTKPEVYSINPIDGYSMSASLEQYLDGSHHVTDIRKSKANAFMIGESSLGYSPVRRGLERALVGVYREDNVPVVFYKIEK